jgi:hypothetical protein
VFSNDPSGCQPDYHFNNRFEHRAATVDFLSGGEADGRFTVTAPWLLNRIYSGCQVYDGSEGGVAYRAGLLVHEGWHAWEHLTGNHSTHDEIFTDPFYYHEKGLYQGSDLWVERSGHGKSHSVKQVQAEFLCDLADAPSARIPLSIRVEAQAHATNMLVNGFGVFAPAANSQLSQESAMSCGAPDLLAGPEPEPDDTCDPCLDPTCNNVCVK